MFQHRAPPHVLPLLIPALALLSVNAAVRADLYGIGRGIGADTFYQINTATGAATPLFSFSNAGTTSTFHLAYNPVTNRFVTVQQNGTTSSTLIEIDATTFTAAAVVHGIPTSAFEGVEYSASLGGFVVSYGTTTGATGRLALLDNGYTLINNNPSTGLPDGDTLFLDGTGALNVLDPNNPYNGWQRNLINNPFGATSIVVAGGSNPFAATDADCAWKADESRLFLTQTTSLARIVGPNNIFSVGPYGPGISITGIAVGPPIPAPASLCLLAAAGAVTLLRGRRTA
ncbi:MAG: hypothetical protein IT437_13075 [Phycisphaerales bacterium]|nr:hypothetical protein [Phycisphaerales bacterium]